MCEYKNLENILKLIKVIVIKTLYVCFKIHDKFSTIKMYYFENWNNLTLYKKQFGLFTHNHFSRPEDL